MTDPTDITVHILREIRDDIRGTRDEMRATRHDLSARIDRLAEATVRGFTELAGEVGATNQRLDQTNQRLDQTNQRLGHLESHFAHFRGFVGDYWRDHEQRLRALEAFTGLSPQKG